MTDFCYRRDGPDDVRIVPVKVVHVANSRYAEGYATALRWWVCREGDEPKCSYADGTEEARTWKRGWDDASADYDAFMNF